MKLAPQPTPLTLDQHLVIQSSFCRSVNLTRDGDSLELIHSYVPTSRALDALGQIASQLHSDNGQRALALIGPYGSGKSAFGLFAGALLANPDDPLRQAAEAKLRQAATPLAKRFQAAQRTPRGYLRVVVNGLPDSLVRQLVTALHQAAERQALEPKLLKRLRRAARPGVALDKVLALIRQVQTAWADAGGAGVLIEIDELGKFLEYESYHPQQREIHLLQLLAEQAAEAQQAPLHIIVMLHQSFEHYSHRLGSVLRAEWQKIQGRFATLAFLEPAEQTLRLMGTAFKRSIDLPDTTRAEIKRLSQQLAHHAALPLGLDAEAAQQVFSRCYPLHPLTALMLPILCQKVAQNERTLFSYLSRDEPFGLQQRLAELYLGDWVGPWDLYDYFLLNQIGSSSDPLIYHRWAEVMTALERFTEQADAPAHDPALRLLKTIGVLNLIGAQRGLKASPAVLELVFGAATAELLAGLEQAALIQLRRYSGEYRVWQGSDFDLQGALQQALLEYRAYPLAETLNRLQPLQPIIARRASITTGTLRRYEPVFTDRAHWPKAVSRTLELPLFFYLAEQDEQPDFSATTGVVAVCCFTERLQETVVEWMALQDLPRHHAALHQDPVAQREYRVWLNNAETEAVTLIRALLEQPETLSWWFAGETRSIEDRRVLQQALSEHITDKIYNVAPLIRNELINRERPSSSAASGRKRLLAAMLSAADQDNLGIEKAPAEKSLYLSLLKYTGLHRCENGRWGFYPPPPDDPGRLRPMWEALAATLGAAGERQVLVPEIYARLQAPPLGMRLGVLPIMLMTYLLAQRREVALYQEGAFCERLTFDQVELLCRRPALFAVERFELAGLQGALFEQYLGSIVGHLHAEPSLLDIVRPLVRFAGQLPEYTQYCSGLSPEAQRVRSAFRVSKSPGVLLFEELPRACGFEPRRFAAEDTVAVERFIARLIQVLRELKQAYPALLAQWQEILAATLVDDSPADIVALRLALMDRYQGLDRYTPEQSVLGAFIRRIAEMEFARDTAWLESVLTLLGNVPPSKWRDSSRLRAELRLQELAAQLRELEQMRYAMPEQTASPDAVLLKVVDTQRGELSRVLRISATQRQVAMDKATAISATLDDLDEATRLAVVAAVLERQLKSNQPISDEDNHDD